MKINAIEVCDFRGFPGPAVYDFQFGDARNLLLYGENGSGKSSLFRAVREFFNRSGSARDFLEFKNILAPTLTAGHVKVLFDNGTTQVWQLGGKRPIAALPASRTALQVGCLDYRSLLETNFSHKGQTVNLFEITVNHLVDRMLVQVGGRTRSIGDLWADVLRSKPRWNHKTYVARCLESIKRFNDGFEPVLAPLIDKASALLPLFPGCDFELGVSFQPIGYDLPTKTFTNQELVLSVKWNGFALANHHDFLNEAKLSAIGLVIYLAGLLVTVPTASAYPKLLVLDDVLIGLDMQNREPVLRLLSEYFNDWQVVLMTHDKSWYEMVQLHVSGRADWTAYEIYVGASGSPVPYKRPGGAGYFLEHAQRHLDTNDLPGAANYTRSAFEWKVKSYCDERSVPVPYRRNPEQMKAEDLWIAAKKHAQEKAAHAIKPKLPALFEAVDLWRKIVLNPLSHAQASTVARNEVQSAINAVKELKFK